MIVSWDWLTEYVNLEMPVEELTGRLTMAGLNLESIEKAGDDLAIDLEVTSNRPDCLGHLGVAREISVLFDQTLKVPDPQPKAIATKTSTVTSVDIECEDLCGRYIARVIRRVKIGPSPAWLRNRLETLGVAAINNVVDITNYVLMECGQPLHAFDFDKLRGQKIIVRRAQPGETIVAIDQRQYELDGEMCVIADADRPVAIGGVMGGLETEIGEQTANVLIETADFSPLSIRNSARKLNLHSPSSYRFERGVDPQQLDWASRRCCELILELAGGELYEEEIYAGSRPEAERPAVRLRYDQLPRLLGIEIPPQEAEQILVSLGLKPEGKAAGGEAAFVPPSWRRDLTREADLIEEVARIHGYDKIPDDVAVPLELSARTLRDRVTDRIRGVLTGAGCFEAITLSFVSREMAELVPQSEVRDQRSEVRGQTLNTQHSTFNTLLSVEHSSRRQENVLRPSLIPSLLQSRRENERHGTFDARLFEIARVYLRAAPGEAEETVEPTRIGLVTGQSFAELKGLLQTLVDALNHRATFEVRPLEAKHLIPGRGAEILLDGKPCGWMGELDRPVIDPFDLRDAVTAAELDLAVLERIAQLVAQFVPLPQFPPVERDLNFVLDEAVTWKELESVVRNSAGPFLESIRFTDQYRGKQIAAGKKSYVMTLSYRSPERTLTSDEVEAVQQQVIDACEAELAATLR